MVIKNMELMHKCCPQHLRMGTARMKEDKETEDNYEQERVNIKSKMRTKYRSEVVIVGQTSWSTSRHFHF